MEPEQPPAIVQFLEEVERCGHGDCEQREDGLSVTIGRWDCDFSRAVELINRIDADHISLGYVPMTDRHFAMFRNAIGWKSVSLDSIPIRGKGLDSLPECPLVEEVCIDRCPLMGEELVGLRRFPNTKSLHIETDDIDVALKHLAVMRSLESLVILSHNTPFSGEGFRYLSDHPCLKQIELRNTSVRRGFHHLANCRSLERIVASSSWVDDQGMVEISQIQSLKQVSVISNKITNEVLKALAGHPNIEQVLFVKKINQFPQITEECLESVCSIPNLKSLYVSCRITNRGVEYLKKINKLESLLINWEEITPDDIRAIRKALPSCDVSGPYQVDEDIDE